MSDRFHTKVGIDVVEKVISLKEADQEFLTNKTILAYLGGVSKEFIKDLRETGVLPFYKVRNTIFYKVSDVKKMIERHRV
nr:helix-turn-helix domain-containing protein [uncultured Prevotella sp.]